MATLIRLVVLVLFIGSLSGCFGSNDMEEHEIAFDRANVDPGAPADEIVTYAPEELEAYYPSQSSSETSSSTESGSTAENSTVSTSSEGGGTTYLPSGEASENGTAESGYYVPEMTFEESNPSSAEPADAATSENSTSTPQYQYNNGLYSLSLEGTTPVPNNTGINPYMDFSRIQDLAVEHAARWRENLRSSDFYHSISGNYTRFRVGDAKFKWVYQNNYPRTECLESGFNGYVFGSTGGRFVFNRSGQKVWFTETKEEKDFHALYGIDCTSFIFRVYKEALPQGMFPLLRTEQYFDLALSYLEVAKRKRAYSWQEYVDEARKEYQKRLKKKKKQINKDLARGKKLGDGWLNTHMAYFDYFHVIKESEARRGDIVINGMSTDLYGKYRESGHAFLVYDPEKNVGIGAHNCVSGIGYNTYAPEDGKTFVLRPNIQWIVYNSEDSGVGYGSILGD